MRTSTPSPPCFAVAGSPILGSLSAPLYRALFARLGVNAHYTRLSTASAEQALELANELGLSGLNATSPIKESLPPLLHEIHATAQAAGAVNTAVHRDGHWFGDNTDVVGVIDALTTSDVSPRSTRVLVLGAGGAARAVLVALRHAGFERVVVCNRGHERAQAISRDLDALSCGLDALESTLAASDLLISCVPGDPGLIPAAWLRPGMWVLDADYRAKSLVRAARLAGCRLIPGSDWLALQAAANCERFLGGQLDDGTRAWLCDQAATPRTIAKGPVVLVGFSGAGKSTVGSILARLLGWAFVDTDLEVQLHAGTSINDLFAREGEAGFRLRERRAVARALSNSRAVVALGGGALLHPQTLAQLEHTGLCMLLHAPLARCTERLTRGDRPLLGPGSDPLPLWHARRQGYLARAELVLSTDGINPDTAARRLLLELDSSGMLTSPGGTRTLHPGAVRGRLAQAPRSKSHGIRALCAATLAPGVSVLERAPHCADMGAAVSVCEQLGATVLHRAGALEVHGIGGVGPAATDGQPTVLDCGESALCLRLFACVAAFLGGPFLLEARASLRRRDMSALMHALGDLGVHCTGEGSRPPLFIEGPPRRGRVLIDASGGSQVLSGLLMAAPIPGNPLLIEARGLVSRPYVALTVEVLRQAGISIQTSPELDRYELDPSSSYRAVDTTVECDWSALAFLAVAGATTGSIEITGVRHDSLQGDRAVLGVLADAGAELEIRGASLQVRQRPLQAFRFDATHHPDLFPPLAVLAAACDGISEITGVSRLHNKESDRALALQQELGALGVTIALDGDRMLVTGGPISPAQVDAHGDHRIAMALAVATLRASGPCELTGAEHVAKSYPRFFHDLNTLCGGPQ